MMQEEGAVVIGEPSGGGSCNVLMVTQPDGTIYCISYLDGILLKEDGQDVENGCKVDVPIEPKETVNADGSISYDYSAYFDLERLDKIMDEWFSKEGQTPLAE